MVIARQRVKEFDFMGSHFKMEKLRLMRRWGAVGQPYDF